MVEAVKTDSKKLNTLFDNFLVQNNLRRTQERKHVFLEINKTNKPFEVEDIFFNLRKKNHRVSRATIHATTKLLVKHNFITQLKTLNSTIKFEKINKNKSVLIKNGKVFVNVEGEMKETTDPNFIGCALLDALEVNNNLEINI